MVNEDNEAVSALNLPLFISSENQSDDNSESEKQNAKLRHDLRNLITPLLTVQHCIKSGLVEDAELLQSQVILRIEKIVASLTQSK